MFFSGKSIESTVRKKGKKIASSKFLTEVILPIRDKIWRIEVFSNSPIKDRLKTLETTEVKAMKR